MNTSLKIGYNVTFQNIDVISKEVVKEAKFHNDVVNSGLESVATHLASTFTHVGIGTGTTAVVATDTALETEYTRSAVTATSGGTGIRTWDHTFSVASGVSETITEAGLFSASSGGTMFNRAVDSPGFTLDSSNDLRVLITVTVSDA